MSYITFSLISLFLGPANPSITSVDFALSLTKSFLPVFCIGLSFSSNLDPLEIFLELKLLAAMFIASSGLTSPVITRFMLSGV